MEDRLKEFRSRWDAPSVKPLVEAVRGSREGIRELVRVAYASKPRPSRRRSRE
jgi:hypothetical protein